jgi:hypothetical protein
MRLRCHLTDNQHYIPTGCSCKPVYDLRMLIELNEPGWYSGNAVHVLGRRSVRTSTAPPTILTEVSHCFPRTLHQISGSIPQFYHDCFLKNDFKLTEENHENNEHSWYRRPYSNQTHSEYSAHCFLFLYRRCPVRIPTETPTKVTDYFHDFLQCPQADAWIVH